MTRSCSACRGGTRRRKPFIPPNGQPESDCRACATGGHPPIHRPGPDNAYRPAVRNNRHSPTPLEEDSVRDGYDGYRVSASGVRSGAPAIAGNGFVGTTRCALLALTETGFALPEVAKTPDMPDLHADTFAAERRDSLVRYLRKHIAGEVRFDDTTRHLYATDASHYQIHPLGVAIPKTLDDLTSSVQIAADLGVPITVPRRRDEPDRSVHRHRSRHRLLEVPGRHRRSRREWPNGSRATRRRSRSLESRTARSSASRSARTSRQPIARRSAA